MNIHPFFRWADLGKALSSQAHAIHKNKEWRIGEDSLQDKGDMSTDKLHHSKHINLRLCLLMRLRWANLGRSAVMHLGGSGSDVSSQTKRMYMRCAQVFFLNEGHAVLSDNLTSLEEVVEKEHLKQSSEGLREHYLIALFHGLASRRS